MHISGTFIDNGRFNTRHLCQISPSVRRTLDINNISEVGATSVYTKILSDVFPSVLLGVVPIYRRLQ
jgi:hypothetical protein